MNETETAVESTLLVEREGGLVTLTLNRPKVLNSLDREMMAAVTAELKKAERDASVRVVVLTGAGRVFCAGADLADLKNGYPKDGAPALGGVVRRYLNPMIRQIRRMEKPVVGVVGGVAAGAGAALAWACDIKICSASAKFVPGFIRVGLAPDSGFSHFLSRGMGTGLGLEHAWTGKPIPARLAEQFGLVNRVVASDELKQAVRDLVDKLLAAPPAAAALTKRAFNRAAGADLDAALEYEAHLQDILGKTKDHHEGINAFLEGRPPKFTGE